MNAWDAISYEGKPTILGVFRNEAARLAELARRPQASVPPHIDDKS
jgi:hypothetical protein